jgi:hypothetical protein
MPDSNSTNKTNQLLKEQLENPEHGFFRMRVPALTPQGYAYF